MKDHSVLLIEDNEDLRLNTAEILELAGYKVRSASDGKSGVELILEEAPDIIVCDIMMPVLDGFGVLHAVRKHEALKNIPFIFLTAKSERPDIRKGMESGAEDYLTKPFEPVELLKAIEIQLQKSAASIVREKEESSEFKADAFDPQTFHKKHVLFEEGNRPQFLYCIRSGKVRMFKTHPDGKELTTRLLGDGDYVGLEDVIEDTLYATNAEVLEESVIHLIPLTEFRAAIRKDLRFAFEIISRMSREMVHQQDRSIALAYDSLRMKVASALLEWQSRFGEEGKDVIIQISREQLASLAGTATESAIRVLADFKVEKIIEIQQGDIIIKDIQKLRKIVA